MYVSVFPNTSVCNHEKVSSNLNVSSNKLTTYRVTCYSVVWTNNSKHPVDLKNSKNGWYYLKLKIADTLYCNRFAEKKLLKFVANICKMCGKIYHKSFS